MPTPELKKLLCLVIFLFNHSKNNAVLEPRTGYFRGLKGFEAKDLKVCPRGRPRILAIFSKKFKTFSKQSL